jgi:tetratricopeptide (TPR) repeat protein
MMNLLIAIIFYTFICTNILFAKNIKPDTCIIYKAYLQNDMSLWISGMDEFTRKYQDTNNLDFLYESAVAQYGLIGYYIGNKLHDEAEQNIDIIEKNLDILIKSSPYASSAYALKAGINGLKIGIHPIKAVYLGQFNQDYIKASFDLDQNNPIIWMEKGNAAFHTPSIFGGSYIEAIEYFSKAITLFEKENHLTKCNWLYMHCLIWIGKSYEMTNDYLKALKIYEKILKLEPELSWVKNTLYPELKKKIK